MCCVKAGLTLPAWYWTFCLRCVHGPYVYPTDSTSESPTAAPPSPEQPHIRPARHRLLGLQAMGLQAVQSLPGFFSTSSKPQGLLAFLLTFQNEGELTGAEGCTRRLGTCPGSRLDCLNDGWRRKAGLGVSLSHFLPTPTPSGHLEPFIFLALEGRKEGN